ncbi:TPR-like protein [Aureobasidium sp. EXF-3400]|nr:TPR-like protein [Aureobasidium sp. EXF-12344]KAI4777814.1 TPR-like protein [Aureobasidium sp. EXF-3400]
MADALQTLFRRSLPDEISTQLTDRLSELESGDFSALLQSEDAQELLGHSPNSGLNETKLKDCATWNEFISIRLSKLLANDEENATYKQSLFFIIGYAALLAFLQSNATGPPLPFTPSKTVLPQGVAEDKQQVNALRRQLIDSLAVDGIAAYRLTPNIELLCLANVIISNPEILENVSVSRWAKLRVTFMHQRLLSEDCGTLQDKIFADVDAVQEKFFDVSHKNKSKASNDDAKVEFLLERASIQTFYGLDKKARSDLDEAAAEQDFQFALTGIMGRRTKFQQHDVSQLVVLAKSARDAEEAKDVKSSEIQQTEGATSGPKNLDLNDDTLLESISFTEKPTLNLDVQTKESLSPALAELDPSNQPKLLPLDSIILLALASSITNTSPANGLTREETLPYATRVLEGGSSNWQVYTQGLLVRSRMEGYRSRTIERGLLQLQAVVDQVIADTTETPADGSTDVTATSFLRKGESEDSAPASERLRYIFQIAAPTRWELEGELAQRWVALGGLRSALDIYIRLEMWAEAALCYAATEKEETAKRMVRRQLFHATNNGDEENAGDEETWEGPERQPPPADAARLYCIIGDLDQDASMFEKAWEVSGQRYARAQRSLGRMYIGQRDMIKAADAYAKSLKANQLNHASWFAMGCCLLELAQFEKAAEAFSRTVQLEESDAEAWSNLAAALLKNQAPTANDETTAPAVELAEDEDESMAPQPKKADPQQNRKDALRALKRAATLKHDSHRIWENLLIVAASLSPPDYDTVLTAQRHIIDLRSKTSGESCIDVEIMEHMIRHVIVLNDEYDPAKPGFERLLVEMFDKKIVPLITSSRELWQLYAKLCLWRKKPTTALDANEKAWRAVSSQPGWETESEDRWNVVVEATIDLCDAYESLGQMEKTEGMAAGSGALVAKDWKFKARSAIRSIMGKGKDCWEDTDGWERLKEALDGLRG